MSSERYSAELIVAEQDFAECGWKSTLVNEERESYSSMWQAFTSTARKASEDNRPSHGKALWLGVKEVSRLISRIRHRQFGVLVTTSIVARQAHQEVREDRHPNIFYIGARHCRNSDQERLQHGRQSRSLAKK